MESKMENQPKRNCPPRVGGGHTMIVVLINKDIHTGLSILKEEKKTVWDVITL